LLADRRSASIYLPLAGIGLAALWPITAYVFNPLLLPLLIVVAGTAALVMWRPEYGLALAVALTPFLGAHIYQSPGAGLALPSAPFRLLVPAIAFGVLVYGTLIRGQDRRGLPGVFWGIAALLIAAVASAFQATDPGKAVPDVFLLLTGAALFVAILNVCQTREQLLVVVGGALAGLLLASVQGVIQHFAGVYSTLGFVAANGESLNRIQGSFGHPNEYAAYLAILLPFAVVVALIKSLPTQLRALGLAAAAFAVPALVYSYARAALVTMIIGAILWLVITRPKIALWATIVLGVGALLFTPASLRERFSATGQQDVSVRTDVAGSAVDIWNKDPWLGVGIGNFQLAYEDLSFAQDPGQRRLLHNQQILVPTAAPSQYLNSLAEQGLLGVAALGIFAIGAVVTAFRVSRAPDPTVRGLGLGIGMGVAGLILYSTLEISMQEDQVLALFALLAIGSVAQNAFEPQPRRTPPMRDPAPSTAKRPPQALAEAGPAET
jgi:O-antigen ligase